MHTTHPNRHGENDQTALSTGELACFLGMSSQGLRWYEQQHFVKPEKTPNGYREYTSDDLRILSRMRFYRQCGFSTEAIESLLDSDPHNARTFVESRIRDIERSLAIEHAKLDSLKKNARLLERAQHAPLVEISALEAFWLRKIYRMENGRLITRRTSSKYWTSCLPLAHYYTARTRDDTGDTHDLVGVGISETKLAYANDQVKEDIENGEATYIPQQKALYAILAPTETPFLPAILDEACALCPAAKPQLDGSIYARPITCHRVNEGVQTYWEVWLPLRENR